MSEPRLPAVVVEPRGEPSASVIWLHGLGADGHDFGPIVPELGAAREGVRFVFPHAPMRPVSINGGAVMRAWYDIVSLDLERHVPHEHLEESKSQLGAWIAHERGLGIPAARIVVAGFSQGGAIALFSGLQHEERLGGVLALSCYHPELSRIEEDARGVSAGLPVFLAHGSMDPVVPMALAERTRDELRDHGYACEWHDYPMPHSVCAEEVQHIAAWLSSTLST